MTARALAIVAALIVAPSVASADGIPAAPPAATAIYCCEPAPRLWTGFYIGTNVGAAWSDPGWQFPAVGDFSTIPGQSFSPSASGWIWGGHLGVNYQFHQFLVGAEASYAGNQLRETVVGPFAVAPNDHFLFAASDLFTATGRIGLVAFHNQFLFYGKGGYASSVIELQATSVTGVIGRSGHRESGWIAGGGVESRIVSSLIFGLEYNYVSLSGDRFPGVTGGTAPGTPFNFDINNLQMHTVTARLSILFGPQACCSEGLLGKY